MALFEALSGKLQKVESVTFIREDIKERQQLQQWLLEEPSALGENLFILSEEYGDWEDSRRRIDLLALDENANLVVIEIKRTDDGGHMDLQAIRYAAMISSMSFEDIVQAHEVFLAKKNREGNARERILSFLGASLAEPMEISTVPRILLVAQDFSLEITTTVIWLVERGIDIRCIQVLPYKVDERLFLDIRQILPLKEASEYQVRIRKKDENVRRTSSGEQRERTLQVLERHGVISAGTEIEIVPEALPKDGVQRDPKTFRATIGDLRSRSSVVWQLDGKPYSASKLTHLLRDEHGMTWLLNNIFTHWRVAGESKSMWDHAESLTRNERFNK
ncbi:MAG TPA: hypothetical protein VK539_15890 [Myxococcaceae bacterium]|nr:hypothetical protein [Myxococcaceae bacterium]